MKQEFTTEQILDALQTHKTVQKAANSLCIRYPEMQKLMRKHGICANRNVKEKPVNTGRNDDEHAFRGAINRWYKRLFQRGGQA